MTIEVATTRQEWFAGRPGDWAAWRSKVTFASRAQVLELAVQIARPVPGNIVEFGVWKGASTRVIRDELLRCSRWDRAQRRKRIYACDSFEGLPTGYENIAKGTFATPVPRLHGIRIVKGFFEDSLTPALATEVGQVSLAHFDADLYSATVCALEWITPLLHAGSLLLFDEFVGEDAAEERAFLEWTERTGTETALIALFGRESSGHGGLTDRRALFQVIGDKQIQEPPPLFPKRLRRRLTSRW
ncbi:TylF/MycF/NovP-related O-methyltransferase [Frankia sp. Cr2]|uniref:TylF/MycF/NovP-related O-methyltransferase n=1 Tax=Frankia sp. Cr2 TaxID=3073932 RepID=UPI002AD411C7|nr:TylF/MycF/NovP-related O-methyltransferase [Frankia sp. Cr2]